MENKKGIKTFKDLLYEVIIPKVEVISLIILALSILFKILKLQGAPELLMISLSTYAGTTYLKAFVKTELQGWLDNLLIKIGAISSAVLIIGILFLILNLSGSIEMLTIGSISLGISIIVIFIKFLKSEKTYYKKLLIQHTKTIVIVIGVYLLKFLV
jgi:hypothetical protein